MELSFPLVLRRRVDTQSCTSIMQSLSTNDSHFHNRSISRYSQSGMIRHIHGFIQCRLSVRFPTHCPTMWLPPSATKGIWYRHMQGRTLFFSRKGTRFSKGKKYF